MEYNIKCQSGILHYAIGDNKYAGLLYLDDNKEILDTYSEYDLIASIPQRVADSEYMDKNSILNDIVEFCKGSTNLEEYEIDDIINYGFKYFFVIDTKTGKAIISNHIDITKSEDEYIVSYQKSGRKIPVMDYHINPQTDTKKNPMPIIKCTVITLLLLCLLYIIYRFLEPTYIDSNESHLKYTDELYETGCIHISSQNGETIKYCIFAPEDSIREINWKQEGSFVIKDKGSTYMRPKKSCQIVLHSSSSDKEESVTIQFNFCQFIEYSIISGENEDFLNELLENSKDHPLTIDYGNGIEEVWTEINTDVFYERIKESSLHIKKVESYPSDLGKEDPLIMGYPPLKKIFCTENL